MTPADPSTAIERLRQVLIDAGCERDDEQGCTRDDDDVPIDNWCVNCLAGVALSALATETQAKEKAQREVVRFDAALTAETQARQEAEKDLELAAEQALEGAARSGELETELTAEREARQQAERERDRLNEAYAAADADRSAYRRDLAASERARVDAEQERDKLQALLDEGEDGYRDIMAEERAAMLKRTADAERAREQAEQSRNLWKAYGQKKRAEADSASQRTETARKQIEYTKYLETERDALRTALETLKANAECSLRTTGQRAGVPMFVPSVAKRVLDIVAPALSAAQARETQPRPATDPDWPERVG